MDDREFLIRTVLGEAADQGPLGQAAVVHNVLNRVGDPEFGGSIRQVVTKPGAYETWGNGSAMRYAPGTDEWQHAAGAVDSALSGQSLDPSNGAVHFYAPRLQAQLGRQKPNWAQGPSMTIGDHQFYDFRRADANEDEIDPLGSWGGGGQSTPSAQPSNKEESIDPLGSWVATPPEASKPKTPENETASYQVREGFNDLARGDAVTPVGSDAAWSLPAAVAGIMGYGPSMLGGMAGGAKGLIVPQSKTGAAVRAYLAYEAAKYLGFDDEIKGALGRLLNVGGH